MEQTWIDFILFLIGGGLLTTGAVGLAMGGRLPLTRFPESVLPVVKLGLVFALLIGITLVLDRGHPDLLERVILSLG